MNSSIKFDLYNHEITSLFGKLLGSFLGRGQVIALTGELGAGKTTLVKSIALGVGISKDIIVSSPSYTLINEYEGPIPVYHFDLYRLNGVDEIYDLGYSEYIEGNGISIIEWADKAPEVFSEEYLEINMIIIEEDKRQALLTGKGTGCLNIMEKMKSRFKEYIIDL